MVDENLTYHRWKPNAQMQQQIGSDKPAIAQSQAPRQASIRTPNQACPSIRSSRQTDCAQGRTWRANNHLCNLTEIFQQDSLEKFWTQHQIDEE